MKKEELRSVIVFCLGLLMFVILFNKIFNKDNLSDSLTVILAGGSSAILTVVVNIKQRIHWAGLIGVIPAVLIVFFEIGRVTEMEDAVYFFYPICASAIVLLLCSLAIYLMKRFQDKHYPGKPSLKSLKKGFFTGLAITTLFSFIVVISI